MNTERIIFMAEDSQEIHNQPGVVAGGSSGEVQGRDLAAAEGGGARVHSVNRGGNSSARGDKPETRLPRVSEGGAGIQESSEAGEFKSPFALTPELREKLGEYFVEEERDGEVVTKSVADLCDSLTDVIDSCAKGEEVSDEQIDSNSNFQMLGKALVKYKDDEAFKELVVSQVMCQGDSVKKDRVRELLGEESGESFSADRFAAEAARIFGFIEDGDELPQGLVDRATGLIGGALGNQRGEIGHGGGGGGNGGGGGGAAVAVAAPPEGGVPPEGGGGGGAEEPHKLKKKRSAEYDKDILMLLILLGVVYLGAMGQIAKAIEQTGERSRQSAA